MSQSFGTKVFVKGNNYMHQLGLNSPRRGFKEWKLLKALEGSKMLQVEGYIGHSYILAENGLIFLKTSKQPSRQGLLYGMGI